MYQPVLVFLEERRTDLSDLHMGDVDVQSHMLGQLLVLGAI